MLPSHKSERTFCLPAVTSMTQAAMDRALLAVIHLTGRGGRPSWFGDLAKAHQLYIYELFHEGKTVGFVATHLKKVDWVAKSRKLLTTKSIRKGIGKFMERLEDYFIQLTKDEAVAKEQNETLPAINEEYEKPIPFTEYPKHEQMSVAAMLRNAEKMELRINEMFNTEREKPIHKLDEALTRAMTDFHKLHREIISTLRQGQFSIGSGLSDAGHLSPLFENEKRVEKITAVANKFLELTKAKSIKLIKSADGKFTRAEDVDGNGGAIPTNGGSAEGA